jgi:NAD-dependent dihydropyrimidine dehydrogenase PreA subunit
MMLGLRYLEDVVTLDLDSTRCTGCRMCVEVCPHAVFAVNGKKAEIVDRDACMECGACAVNCPVEAIKVEAGVGCAAAVLSGYLPGKNNKASCGCDGVACAESACCVDGHTTRQD